MILKYGWHGTYALAALWDDEQRQTMWQDYMAVTSGMLLRVYGSITGGAVDFPSWIEFAYPEAKTVDNRTPAQIKSDIVKGLIGA